MYIDCWAVLEIAATKDEREIRRAYARKLKQVRPDEDPVGFQRLVEARDQAMLLAEFPDDVEINAQDDDTSSADLPPSSPLPEVTLSDDSGSQADEVSAPVTPLPDNSEEIETKREIYETLDQLIDVAKNNAMTSASAWKADSWSALFDRAALLGFDEHRIFHDTIARRLGEFLPDTDGYRAADLDSFEAGVGPVAVVEQIEKECEFSWVGKHFGYIASAEGAERYFSWLSIAQMARVLLGRRQNAETAYINPENNLPVYPPEDEAVLVHDYDLRKYYEKAKEIGRWPLQFDQYSFLMPAGRLFNAGMKKSAIAVAALTCAFGVLLYKLQIDRYASAALCVLAFIAIRVYFSATFYKKVLKKFSGYVASADRLGLLFPPVRRSYLADFLKPSGAGNYFSLLDVAATLVIVALGIGFMTSWFDRDLLARPAEAVLSEQVVKLMAVTAENEAIETSTFFQYLDRIQQASSKIRQNGEAKALTVGETDSPRAIITLISDINRLAERTSHVLQTLAPVVEREKKLRVLMKLYQEASFEDRGKLAQSLSDWRGLLEGTASSSQTEAALWQLVPPRQSRTPLLVSPEAEMRQAALFSWLDRELAGISDFHAQDISRRIGELQLLLAMSDEELLASVNKPSDLESGRDKLKPWLRNRGSAYDALSSNDLFGGLVASLVAGATQEARVDLELKKRDIPTDTTVSDKLVPVWKEGARGWIAFLDTAKICLGLEEVLEQQIIRDELGRILRQAVQSSQQNVSGYWSRVAQRLATMPVCSLRYTAIDHAGKSGAAKGRGDSQFNANIYEELIAGNIDEAFNAARFAGALALAAGDAKDNLRSIAYNYLAYNRMTHGEPQQALLYLDRGIQRYSDCKQNRAQRGIVLKAAGENERALKELETAKWKTTCAQPVSTVDFSDSVIDEAIKELEDATGQTANKD
ncbi:J domain-containing protein [Brucellaceae bacterium D45D]